MNLTSSGGHALPGASPCHIEYNADNLESETVAPNTSPFGFRMTDSASPKRHPAPGADRGSPAEKAEYVRIELQNSIERVRLNRRKNQRRATIIKVTTILLSGLATVLLGLQLGERSQMILKQAAFVCGACVTMLTALEPFFNFRSLWIEHERALAALYRIESDLNFYLRGTTADNVDISVIEVFHERCQGAWDDLSNTWLRVRAGPEGKGKP